MTFPYNSRLFLYTPVKKGKFESLLKKELNRAFLGRIRREIAAAAAAAAKESIKDSSWLAGEAHLADRSPSRPGMMDLHSSAMII